MSKVTLSGRPADPNYAGPAPQPPDADGLFGDSWILSDDERLSGFVQPVREAYRHDRCGVHTKMNRLIAETFARNPKFYGSTYCATCRNHYPVGSNGEFVWKGTNQKVGT